MEARVPERSLKIRAGGIGQSSAVDLQECQFNADLSLSFKVVTFILRPEAQRFGVLLAE